MPDSLMPPFSLTTSLAIVAVGLGIVGYVSIRLYRESSRDGESDDGRENTAPSEGAASHDGCRREVSPSNETSSSPSPSDRKESA